MAKYGLYRFQEGGCDYMIACGHAFDILPDEINTLDAALEYAKEEFEIDEQEPERRLSKCQIVEICQIHEVNPGTGRVFPDEDDLESMQEEQLQQKLEQQEAKLKEYDRLLQRRDEREGELAMAEASLQKFLADYHDDVVSRVEFGD